MAEDRITAYLGGGDWEVISAERFKPSDVQDSSETPEIRDLQSLLQAANDANASEENRGIAAQTLVNTLDKFSVTVPLVFDLHAYYEIGNNTEDIKVTPAIEGGIFRAAPERYVGYLEAGKQPGIILTFAEQPRFERIVLGRKRVPSMIYVPLENLANIHGATIPSNARRR